MTKFTLRCPACHFSKDVELQKIPEKTKRVTCPKCQHVFPFEFSPAHAFGGRSENIETPPAPEKIGNSPTGSADTKAIKQFLAVFLLLVVVTVGIRLWASERAIDAPYPNLLAVSQNGVAVIAGQSVHLLSAEGDLLWSYPFPDEIWPTQLYWDSGVLCLGDLESKKILTFNTEGENPRTFTGTKLSSHFKVAREPNTGQLFVTDSHRVAVFDEDGRYLRSFGKEGKGPGEFKFPNGLAFDETGQLLIANTKRPSIDIYSPEGRFLRTLITPSGRKYRYPTHVLIAKEQLLLLEREGSLQQGKVRAYDRSGKKLQELPLGDLVSIGDIAVGEGRLFLTDRENRQLLVYSLPDLSPLGSFSQEFDQLCEQWVNEEAFFNKISLGALVALLALCAPVIYFYVRIKKAEAKRISKIDLTRVAGNDAASGVEQKVADLILGPPIKKLHLKIGLYLLGSGVLGVWLAVAFAQRDMPTAYLLGTISLSLTAFVGALIFLMLSGGIAGLKRKQTETLFKRILFQDKLQLLPGEQVEKVALTQTSTSAQDIVLLVFTSRRLLSYSYNWNRIAKVEQFPYEAVQQVNNSSKRLFEVMRNIEVTMTLAGENRQIKYYSPTADFLRQLEKEFSRNIGRESRVNYATLCLSCLKPMQGDFCMTCATRLTPDRNAMWLSFLFPGLGQLRNGEMQKGLSFLIISVVLLMFGYIGVRGWFFEGADLSLKDKFNIAVLVVMMPGLYVANIVDAYRSSIRGRKSG